MYLEQVREQEESYILVPVVIAHEKTCTSIPSPVT